MTTSSIRISVTDTDIDGYEYGAILSDPTEVSRYFRLAYNSENADPWAYADDVILGIISTHPQQTGQDDTDYNESVLEKMSEFVPGTLPDLSAQDKVNALAVSIREQIEETSQMLNANPKLIGLLQTIDTADKAVYMGPISVYRELLDMMSKGFDFWGRISEPGTEQKDVVGNQPYDIFYEYRTSASGTRTNKKFSRLDEIAFSLIPAAEAIKESGEKKKKISDKVNVALNTADKAATDKTKTLIKRNFRQACGIIHMLNRCDTLTRIQVKVHYNPETNQDRVTPKPIHVWMKEDATQTAQLTVQQFLALRPQELTANADVDALVESSKGRETLEEKPSLYPIPADIEQGQSCTNAFATWLSLPKTREYMVLHLRDDALAEFRSAIATIQHQLEWYDEIHKSQSKDGQRKAK